MQRLISLIESLANWRGMLILLALYAIVFGTILVTLGQLQEVTGGYGILDFDRGYSPERVNEVLGSYGPEGMALYRRILFLDIFNPALYALIVACLTCLLWKDRGPRWLALVPLLAALGDYLENAALFLMARAFPDVPEGLVHMGSALSLLKNGLLVVAVIPFLAGLALWLLSLLRRTLA
ncbi:hypothetical protein FGK63_17090 [Ruegeria sediminis]|uniref:Uncharacterized protein n=1 Tax=Ruegeria sediminis TaxID=2583820 RepID=A0ABY2WUR3_9RHOB|nr:hypothetical protein [Ruegeria sediminis]TMV04799.1 hypothetical protein FGK63_17090 [Ruegeria sediminis]